MEELREKIQKLVSEDKLEIAINLLIAEFKSKEDLNEMLIQSARYVNLRKDLISNVIDKDKYDTEINTIRRNVLLFAEKMENEKEEQDIKAIDIFRNDFEYALAKVNLVKLFLENYPADHSMTTSWLHENSNIRSRKLVVDFIRELKGNELIERKKNEDGVYFELNALGKKVLGKLSK